ncbi:MAG: hypothetical protein WKH97_01110 [Casimicrobiaceae bacterium]
MNSVTKTILGSVLAFALLLWVAMWRVTSERVPSQGAPPGTKSLPAATVAGPAPAPVVAVPALRELTPAARSSLPSPLDNTDARAASQPFKPKTEPSPAPLPSPVKPNEHGVIDLSADTSTKAFSEALGEGYRRRLQGERQNSTLPATSN